MYSEKSHLDLYKTCTLCRFTGPPNSSHPLKFLKNIWPGGLFNYFFSLWDPRITDGCCSSFTGEVSDDRCQERRRCVTDTLRFCKLCWQHEQFPGSLTNDLKSRSNCMAEERSFGRLGVGGTSRTTRPHVSAGYQSTSEATRCCCIITGVRLSRGTMYLTAFC